MLLLISGLVIFFLIRGSQARLIDKSVDKLVQVDAESIQSSFDYIIDLFAPQITEFVLSIGPGEQQQALDARQVTELQKEANSVLRAMVDLGLLGMEIAMLTIMKGPLTPKPFLFACSDESLIDRWDMPEYLIKAIEEDKPYLWMEDGIPDLGLKGEQLIVIKKIKRMKSIKEQNLEVLGELVGLGIKPMHQEIKAINDFYDEEKRNTNLFLLAVVGGSIIGVILVTFTLLSYLIHKRITEPIDELSAAAEEVMEGNLDVEIEVRKGEEFEGLKRAFKAMVESFRKILARSVGEE